MTQVQPAQKPQKIQIGGGLDTIAEADEVNDTKPEIDDFEKS